MSTSTAAPGTTGTATAQPSGTTWSLSLRQAETGEEIALDGLPSTCTVRQLLQILQTQHGISSDKAVLFIDGKNERDDSLLLTASANRYPETLRGKVCIYWPRDELAQMANRPRPIMAKNSQVEAILGKVQTVTLATLSDAQITSLLQDMQTVITATGTLIENTWQAADSQIFQDQAADDWVKCFGRLHQEMSPIMARLTDRFKLLGSRYDLIDKTLVDLFAMRLHPSIGAGTLADLPQVGRLLAKIRELMSDRRESDPKGGTRIAGHTRRNVERLLGIHARNNQLWENNSKMLQDTTIREKLSGIVVQIKSYRERLRVLSATLGEERNQLLRTVNNAPARQASVSRIQSGITEIVDMYRSLENLFTLLGDIKLQVLQKIIKVERDLNAPSKFAEVKTLVASYTAAIEDIFEKVSQLNEAPLLYGKILVELVHVAMFDQLLQDESSSANQLITKLRRHEADRRAGAPLTLFEKLVNKEDAVRMVGPPATVQSPSTISERVGAQQTPVKLDDVIAYIGTLERLMTEKGIQQQLSDTIAELRQEISSRRMEDRIAFRSNYPSLPKASGTGGAAVDDEEIENFRLSLKDRDNDLQNLYETLRRRDAEIRLLNERLGAIDSAGSYYVVNAQTQQQQQEQLQVAQQEVKKLQTQVGKMESQVKSLQQLRSDVEGSKVDLERQVGIYKEATARLQQQVDELQMTYASLTADNNRFREVVVEKEDRVSKLLDEKEKLETTLQEKKDELEKILQEKDRDDEEFTIVSQRQDEERKAKLEEQKIAAEKAVEAMEERVTHLAIEVKEYKETSDRLKQQLDDSESEKATNLELLTRAKEELNAMKDTVTQLQMQVAELTTQRDSARDSLQQAETRLVESQANLQAQQTVSETLKQAFNSEQDQTKLTISRAAADLAAEQQTTIALKATVSDANNKIEQLTAKIADLEGKNNTLQSQVKKQEQTQQTLVAEITTRDVKIVQHVEKVMALEQSLSQLTAKIQTCERQLAVKEAENMRNRSETQEWRERCERAAEASADEERQKIQTQQRLSQLEAIAQTRATENTMIRTQITEMQKTVDATRKALEEKIRSAATLEADNNKLAKEVATLIGRLQQQEHDATDVFEVKESLRTMVTYMVDLGRVARQRFGSDATTPSLLSDGFNTESLDQRISSQQVVQKQGPEVFNFIRSALLAMNSTAPGQVKISFNSVEVGDYVLFLPNQRGEFLGFLIVDHAEYRLVDESVESARSLLSSSSMQLQYVVGEVLDISEIGSNGANRCYVVTAAIYRVNAHRGA